MNYLIELFGTDGFPPRWYCGSAWSSLLGWTHIISDFAIFVSYTAIPISLLYLIRNRKDIPFSPILMLFAGFILFCGFNHLVEASLFWVPWYRFSGLIKFLTALISIITAIVLIKNLPLALNISAIIQQKHDLEQLVTSLADEEKFYEDFYENAPDMFASVDNNKRIIKCNNRLIEVLGYTKEEIIGKQVLDLYHPDCMEEMKKSVQFFKEHGYIENSELEFVRKDGSKVAVILNVTPVKDEEGKTLYRRAVWRDISKLHSAIKQIKIINQELVTKQKQLQSITHRLNAVLNSVADGVITISKYGIIESFNKAAESMFGYKESELIGKHVEALREIPYSNEEKAHFIDYLEEIARKGLQDKKESSCLRKDNSTFAAELSLDQAEIEGEVKYICSIRDISNQKATENKLTEVYSQIKTMNEDLLLQNREYAVISNRLNAVLNGTADGIITISADGLIESFNYAACQMFGYSPEEVIGKNTTILNPPQRFNPKTINKDLKTLVTETNNRNEEVALRKDGTIFPTEYSLSQATIDGETKFIVIMRDISGRKKIENELKITYEKVLTQKQQLETITNRLNAVLNSTADAILTISQEGIIESFNHSAEKMYLYKDSEVIGKPASIFGTEPESEKVPDSELGNILRSLVTTNDKGRELQARKKDGSIFYTEFLMNEVIIEGKIKFIISVRDISNRKLIENQLVEAYSELLAQKQQFEYISKRLSAVLNSTADAIITISAEGIIESFNHSAELIFGYSSDEIIGKSSDCLSDPKNKITPEETEYDTYLRSFSSKIKGMNNITTAIRKDGIIFPIEYSLVEIDIEGETKFISNIRDISERKIIEDKLKSAYHELEEFVYIASHDLKEPLRGIHNYATFLIEDYAEIIDTEGKDKLYTLKYLTTRLDKFLDDLLYYSRVGKTELSIKLVDLNKLVVDVVESLKITIEEKKIKLTINELPQLVCDETRVAEVFRNLITNAMKYNDKPEKWIDIGYNLVENDKSKPTYVFYVKDNGIGIPDKYYDVIFKIFKRLHGREKFGGGSGAGLTIVKKIITQHNGKIWVESKAKEGTTFYFTLQEDNKEDESTFIAYN